MTHHRLSVLQLAEALGNVSEACRQYSLDARGRKVSDEQIKKYLCELIAGEESVYGYRKLAVRLREDYGLRINHKKVYRLCKELGILGPKRREKPAHLKRLPRRDIVDGPNQLWEVDVKYGYIAGQDSFFFQLSLIDVFDRTVLAYHLGLTCTALDACRVVRQAAVAARDLRPGGTMPKVRTDNGPQFALRMLEPTSQETSSETSSETSHETGTTV